MHNLYILNNFKNVHKQPICWASFKFLLNSLPCYINIDKTYFNKKIKITKHILKAIWSESELFCCSMKQQVLLLLHTVLAKNNTLVSLTKKYDSQKCARLSKWAINKQNMITDLLFTTFLTTITSSLNIFSALSNIHSHLVPL